MSARTKLNSAYLIFIGTLSVILGIITKSIAMLIVCFGILLAALFHDGSIRPQPTRRRRR